MGDKWGQRSPEGTCLVDPIRSAFAVPSIDLKLPTTGGSTSGLACRANDWLAQCLDDLLDTAVPSPTLPTPAPLQPSIESHESSESPGLCHDISFLEKALERFAT